MKNSLLIIFISAICISLSLVNCTNGNGVFAETSNQNIEPITLDRGWTSFISGNTINALFIKGNDLWAATTGGVVKWDIKNGTYKQYTTLDGLGGNNISSIAEDKNGNLWFGISDWGFSEWKDNSWHNFTENNGLAGKEVWKVSSDNEGNIWVSTNSGASEWNGTKWQTVDEKDGLNSNQVRAIIQDQKGNMWFITDKGINIFDGTYWKYYDNYYDGLPNDDQIYNIEEDKEGILWLFGGGTITKYDGNLFSRFFIPKDLKTDGVHLFWGQIRSFFQDRDGIYWFVSQDGVVRYDGKNFTSYYKGLSTPDVRSIVQDNDGNLWFGTFFGISRYDGKQWTNYYTDVGLVSNNIYSMFENFSGTSILFSNSPDDIHGYLSRLDGEKWVNIPPSTITSFESFSNLVLSILVDNKGRQWFGTYGSGVQFYDGQWLSYLNKENEQLNTIRNIFEDDKGNVWFGTGDGVIRYNGHWQVFTLNSPDDTNVDINGNHLNGNTTNDPYYVDESKLIVVYAFSQDNSGKLWIGTKKGAYYFDELKQIFILSSELNGTEVRAILKDSQGNLWFGTSGNCIIKYDGTNWTPIIYLNDLPGKNVKAIAQDHQGNIWVATYGDANNYYVGKFDGTSWRQITTKDGLISSYINNIMVDKNGYIWFATEGSGVCVYNPS